MLLSKVVFMWCNRLILPGIILLLGVTAALACGPFFPWQLLEDRAATLKETPANSFLFEVTHMQSPPADGLKAVEGGPSSDSEEATELPKQQLAAIGQMRSSKSDEEAFNKGAVLPASIRLYTAGAVDFKNGKFALACDRFNAVALLPDTEKRARATWAAYMLGRSYAAQRDTAKAAQAFESVRQLAIHGAPDPLGLAVASYGEEARVYLRQAKSYLNCNKVPAPRAQQYSENMANAVALYAQQAAHGSSSGILSLRLVARDLVSDYSKIRASISDPLVQRLLVAYILAYTAWRPPWVGVVVPSASGPVLVGGSQDAFPPFELSNLVAAIQAKGLDHPPDADRLAALAYRSGSFDLAQKLTEKATGPLAAWIKAKLALQKGDLTKAAALYAEASKAFPPAGDRSQALDQSSETLLLGENGVLTLARGEYVDALAILYPMSATYWGDVAYIAERVLTADELRKFVDAGIPLATSTPNPPIPPELTLLPNAIRIDFPPPEKNWFAPDPSASLHNLLARRLVREGRYMEAMRYFTDSQVTKRVGDYAQALHEAAHRWRRVDRARGWYQAAVLARKSGMEMMGYEGPPDYLAIGGGFDWGLGETRLGRDFVTSGERARFESSAAQPDFRFHYRYVAVEEARRAADLLPPRSQAFAAVLCHGTQWMLETERGVALQPAGSEPQERARQLYRRYLKQGPYVRWAADFGHDCPDPDFASAAKFHRTQFLKRAHHLARHQWLIAVFLLLSALGLGAVRRLIVERPLCR